MNKLQQEIKNLKQENKTLRAKLAKVTGPTWEDQLNKLVESEPVKVEQFIRNGGTLPSNYKHADKKLSISLSEVAHQRAITTGPEVFIEQLKAFIG